MLPFYKGKTILDLQLENLKSYFPETLIIVATTTCKADDILADKYSNDKLIEVFRGDENNVLKRFVDAAHKFDANQVIRICSDNPFLMMPYCQSIINEYLKAGVDYVSYGFSDGTPAIRSHTGLFAEIVSLNALEAVLNTTGEALYLEHVTNYIYTHPGQFRSSFIKIPEFIDEMLHELRLTIDTPQDFSNMQKLYLAVLGKYGNQYSAEQLINEVKNDKALISAMKEQIKQYAK